MAKTSSGSYAASWNKPSTNEWWHQDNNQRTWVDTRKQKEDSSNRATDVKETSWTSRADEHVWIDGSTGSTEAFEPYWKEWERRGWRWYDNGDREAGRTWSTSTWDRQKWPVESQASKATSSCRMRSAPPPKAFQWQSTSFQGSEKLKEVDVTEGLENSSRKEVLSKMVDIVHTALLHSDRRGGAYAGQHQHRNYWSSWRRRSRRSSRSTCCSEGPVSPRASLCTSQLAVPRMNQDVMSLEQNSAPSKRRFSAPETLPLELPMLSTAPPSSDSWDWPLTRSETWARVRIIERQMHLVDKQILEKEVEELRR